jgi:hypothetical protein
MNMHIYRSIPLLPDLVEKRGFIAYFMMMRADHMDSGGVDKVCTGNMKKTVIVLDI